MDRLKVDRSNRASHRKDGDRNKTRLFGAEEEKFTARIKKTIAILRHLQKARARRD